MDIGENIMSLVEVKPGAGDSNTNSFHMFPVFMKKPNPLLALPNTTAVSIL